MKVLHVHSGNLYGGVETFLATLARARHAAPAMQMSVALSFDGQIGAELRAQGVDTHLLGEVRLRRPASVWRARRALATLLAREKIAVAVCHQAWPHAIFGPVIKRLRVPLVLWVHMEPGRHWLERLAWRTEPDWVVTNSRFTASRLPLTRAHVETIYSPLMCSGGRDAVSRRNVRHALDTGTDETVIVQVSRMEVMKGQTILLEALATLRGQPGWTLWQVGGAQRAQEAGYLESLRLAAERLGIADRVRFLGHRSDVPAFLNAADIFCQPSLAPEGFGISVVEAMFAELPVVTSALGGALEIVDNSCGFLLPPGDVAALAGVLGPLLKDPARRERLGHAGCSRARQLCDAPTQVRKIADLMERIA